MPSQTAVPLEDPGGGGGGSAGVGRALCRYSYLLTQTEHWIIYMTDIVDKYDSFDNLLLLVASCIAYE